MADIYSIAIQIDASKAKSGGDQVKSSLDQIKSSLQDTANSGKELDNHFGVLTGTISKLTSGIGILGTALIGLGIVELTKKVLDLGKGFIDAESPLDSYRASLETTTGSVYKARQIIEEASKFSAEHPIFDTAQVAEASDKLERLGIDAAQYMKELGDTAASVRKPLIDVVNDFTKAMMGQYKSLKDYGISAVQLAAQAGYDSVKSMKETSKGMMDGAIALIELWQQKFSGGMDKAEQTWAGMTTSLSNYWKKFKEDVMEAGVFDVIKSALSGILDYLKQLQQDGALKQWAKDTASAILSVFDTAITALLGMIDAYQKVGTAWRYTTNQLTVYDLKSDLQETSKEIGVLELKMSDLQKKAQSPFRDTQLEMMQTSLKELQGEYDKTSTKLIDLESDQARMGNGMQATSKVLDVARTALTNIRNVIQDAQTRISSTIPVITDWGYSWSKAHEKTNLIKPDLDLISKSAQENASVLASLDAQIEKSALWWDKDSQAISALQGEEVKLIAQHPQIQKDIEERYAIIISQVKAQQDANEALKNYNDLEKLRDQITKEGLDSLKEQINLEGQAIDKYRDLKDEYQEKINTQGMTDVQKEIYEWEKRVNAVRDAYQTAGQEIPADLSTIETAQVKMINDTAALEKWKSNISSIAMDMKSFFTDIFKGILDGTGNLFDDIMKYLKSFLAKVMAEILANKIIIPIYASLVGYTGDLSRLTGGSGSGSGIMNLLGLGNTGTGTSGISAISSLLGLGSTAATTFGGITSGAGLLATLGATGSLTAGLATGGAGTALAVAGGATSASLAGVSTGLMAVGTALTAALPIIGAVAGLGILAYTLFSSDNPQPKFNTTGTVPGSFQGFLGAKPSDLLHVDTVNEDWTSASGQTAEQVQAIYDAYTGGLQKTFKGIYDILPDSIKTAWDSVVATDFTSIMKSTSDDTEQAVTGHLKEWLSGFNTTIVQGLLEATAQTFMASDNQAEYWPFANQLLEKISGWFDTQLISATSDNLDALFSQYQQMLTDFFTGISDIVSYATADLSADYKEYYAPSSHPYLDTFNRTTEAIDANIKSITDSLSSLSGPDYTTAILNIGELMKERYTAEMQYIKDVMGLIESAKDTVTSNMQAAGLAGMTDTQQYQFYGSQVEYDQQMAMNAQSPEEKAYWLNRESSDLERQRQMGPAASSEMLGTDISSIGWNAANNPYYLNRQGWIYGQLNATGVDLTTGVQGQHDTVADVTMSTVGGLTDLNTKVGETTTSLGTMDGLFQNLNSTIPGTIEQVGNLGAAVQVAVNAILNAADNLNNSGYTVNA